MTKILTFYLLFLLLPFLLFAEKDTSAGLKILSLEEAINLALDNNFDIKVVDNELAQSIANNTAGNAGMLPSISAGGGINGSLSNTHIEFASGQSQDVKNGKAVGVNTAIQLDWVLFNGMQMFIQKKKLEDLETIGIIRLKQQIQITVAQVIYTYAEIVRQKQQLIALDTALTLAKARMDIAEAKYETGTSSKTDYLQAKVDYNANLSELYLQNVILKQNKDSLIILLFLQEFTEFDVEDSISLNTELLLNGDENWVTKNFNFQLADQEKKLSVHDLNISKSLQYPSLSLHAGYNYAYSRSAFGFALFNRNIGPQANLNLSFPIFNGFNIQRQKKVAQLEVFRKDLLLQQIENNLVRRHMNLWRNYDANRKILQLERENIQYAQENVLIQQSRFRVGVSNTLELREAEISYVTALTRLSNAAYNLKVSETKLLEIENNLIKQDN